MPKTVKASDDECLSIFSIWILELITIRDLPL